MLHMRISIAIIITLIFMLAFSFSQGWRTAPVLLLHDSTIK